MAVVKPFKGIRYNLDKIEKLEDVISPPYDVIGPELQDELYEKSPWAIVRIDYGKSMEGDVEGSDKYSRAAGLFDSWRNDGVMVADEKPSLYYMEEDYQGEFGKTMTRKGFLGGVKVESAESGVYKPHEKTLQGPKADRLKLTVACEANLSPIFSIYDDPEGKIDECFNKIDGDPDVSVVSTDGIPTRVWCVNDPGIVETVAGLMADKSFFIADGHHRYETALNYKELMEAEKGVDPEAPWNYVMMFLVNMWSEGLSILPTHRAVHSLTAERIERFGLEVEKFFDIEECADLELCLDRMKELRGSKHAFGLVDEKGGRFRLLTLKDEVDIASVTNNKLNHILHDLDVTVLHSIVVENLLGIDEEAQSKQLNLKYVKKAEDLVKEVKEGSADLGFLMNPTPVEHVKKVANEGVRMPQKSTFFYPKLSTGLVIKPLS